MSVILRILGNYFRAAWLLIAKRSVVRNTFSAYPDYLSHCIGRHVRLNFKVAFARAHRGCIGGVPAKGIRYRFAPEIVEKLLQLKWWDKDAAWIAAHRKLFCTNLKEVNIPSA